MEWVDIVAGWVGAAAVLLVLQEEVVPELRALFDTADDVEAITALRDRLRGTGAEIDVVQAQLSSSDELSESALTRKQELLRSLEREREADSSELQRREATVRRHQLIVRTVGYVFFVVIGGLVAGLLADQFNAEGISSELQAVIIGGSWISILSGIFSRQRTAMLRDLQKSIARSEEAAAKTDKEVHKLRELASRTVEPDGHSRGREQIRAQAERTLRLSRELRVQVREDEAKCRRINPLSGV